jgi:hypothetical protein
LLLLQDPKTSVLCLLLVAYGCAWAPAWLLPVNLYLIVLASTVTLHGKHEREREYLMWNEDIRDPDDDLKPMQKLAKVIYLLEKFERWMGMFADAVERATNVFSFADERVTIAALLATGLLALFASALLYLTCPGYVFFLGFASLLAPPVLTRALSSSSGRDVRMDDESLRSGGRVSQAIAVLKLMAKTPQLARNIFGRVPTDDDLGHRWIAKRQLVLGEPVVTHVMDEVKAEEADDLWLHEM